MGAGALLASFNALVMMDWARRAAFPPQASFWFGFYPGEESPGQSRRREQGFDHWHWQARYLQGLFECQGLTPKAKSQKCKHGALLNA